jgi:hypothetical protein
MPATLPGLSPRHRNMRLLVGAGKRSDAICPSQAHPSGRALAAAGPMRRQRRIPPRGDRAELAAAREIETSECANGNNGGIAWAKATNARQDSRLTRSIKNATDGTVSLNRRVFQRYPPKGDLQPPDMTVAFWRSSVRFPSGAPNAYSDSSILQVSSRFPRGGLTNRFVATNPAETRSGFRARDDGHANCGTRGARR